MSCFSGCFLAGRGGFVLAKLLHVKVSRLGIKPEPQKWQCYTGHSQAPLSVSGNSPISSFFRFCGHLEQLWVLSHLTLARLNPAYMYVSTKSLFFSILLCCLVWGYHQDLAGTWLTRIGRGWGQNRWKEGLNQRCQSCEEELRVLGFKPHRSITDKNMKSLECSLRN